MRTKPFTLAELAARRQWYADYDKQLEDALISQFGVVDDDIRHADGVHRLMRDYRLAGE